MAATPAHNRLLPWFIGLALIVAVVIYIGVRMQTGACEAPGFVQFIVLAIVPAVYLVLMYLTLTSQE